MCPDDLEINNSSSSVAGLNDAMNLLTILVIGGSHLRVRMNVLQFQSLEVLEKNGMYAILGAHSINGNEKEQQMIDVEEQVIHKHYNSLTQANDIMLVKLSKKATINQYVQTLRLPTKGVHPGAGTICRIAGWGKTEYNGNPADALQEVTVKVISKEECNGRDSYNGKLTTSMMCAGERYKGGKDVCQGDSGGPLICGDTYTGIASFGVQCGKRNFPGVYTRLSDDYLDWIKRETEY
ncbi:GRAA protein, partial [Polypterus senegalus]